MYIFKDAFRSNRKDKKIFMGFGLEHKEDVSKFYVSPLNEGSGKTFIAQLIGEGVNFALDLIKNKRDKVDKISNIWRDATTEDYVYAEIYPSQKWYDAEVIDKNVKCYRLIIQNKNDLNKSANDYVPEIKIGCFDKDGDFLPEYRSEFKEFYSFLPIVAILALLGSQFEDALHARQTLGDYFNDYFLKPNIENFVIACEEFYQSYKNRNYHISYVNVQNRRKTEELQNMFDFFDWIDDRSINQFDFKNLEIKRFEDNDFKEEYKRFIPILPSELIMDDDLKPIANALVCGDCFSFLQHGISGTGKTINCKLICQAIGLPLLETINCTENLDEFVLGKFLPTKNGIEFCESYVTKAIRYGGAVVFEEINFAKPQYLSFLNSLLDDNGFVRLDNNEIVKRHKYFRFFATMNIGYYGTKELNQALYNRFNIIRKTVEIDDDKIRNMMLARVPNCKKNLANMLKVYHKIADKIKREELDFVISPRNLESWARLSMHIGYLAAAETTIVQIAKGDVAMEQSIHKLVRSYKWE